MIPDITQCTGPFSDARDCPVHRPEIAVSGARQTWQLIETAPKDGTWILLYGPDLLHGLQFVTARWQTELEQKRNLGIAWWKVEDGKFGPYDLRGGSPTHWMPLPDPPARTPEPQ